MLYRCLYPIKTSIQRYCTKGTLDNANFLKVTGALGWVLSGIAQVGAILLNNNIPNKEKKFLIPQEILDCVVNVSTFLFITSKAENIGKALVLSGKFLNKSAFDVAQKLKPEKLFNGKFGLNTSKKEFDAALNIIKNTIAKQTNNKQIAQEFSDFYKGAGVITSLIGSIISGNIVTPIIRNRLAAVYQNKTHRNKELVKPQNTTIQTTSISHDTLNKYISMAQNHYSNMKI